MGCFVTLMIVLIGVSLSFCIPHDREFCFNRGQCSETGVTCDCDDYLHYWPSKQCGVYHFDRELQPDWYCYPNAVDYYCSWQGACSENGSICNCFESSNRLSSDRCLAWCYDGFSSVSNNEYGSSSMKASSTFCIPNERIYCSNCNVSSVHYWSSKMCLKFHSTSSSSLVLKRAFVKEGRCRGGIGGTAEVNILLSLGDIGGVGYCAALPGYFDMQSSLAIKAASGMQSFSFPSGRHSELRITTTLFGLEYDRNYTVYCYLEDSFGYADHMDGGVKYRLHTTRTIVIHFLLESSHVSFASKSAYSSLNPMERLYLSLRFSLSTSPSNDILIVPVVRNMSGDVTTSVQFFPPDGISLSAGPVRTGSFLLFGPPGLYKVSLNVFGNTAHHYKVDIANDFVVTIVNSTFPVHTRRPGLVQRGSEEQSTALLDSRGVVQVTLDFPADVFYFFNMSHSLTSHLHDVADMVWRCNKLLLFPGSENSKCLWRDAQTISLVPRYFNSRNSSSSLHVGHVLEVRANVLRPYCFRSFCDDDVLTNVSYQPSRAIVTVAPTTVFRPVVILNTPSQVSSLEGFLVDASLSYGHGGKPWRAVSWQVYISDSSDSTPLVAHLMRSRDVTAPIWLPTHLLLPNRSYVLSLALQNSVQAALKDGPSVSSIVINVREKVCVMSVDFRGPRNVLIPHTEKTVLYVDVFHSHIAICDWRLVDLSWTLHSKSSLGENVRSSLSYCHLSRCVLDGSSLEVDTLYEVLFSATFLCNDNLHSANTSVSLIHTSAVRAVISGHLMALKYFSFAPLTIDGSVSVGRALEYRWFCEDVSIEHPSSDCFFDHHIVTNASKLVLPARFRRDGATYLIRLQVRELSQNSLYGVSDSIQMTIGSTSPDQDNNNELHVCRDEQHVYVEFEKQPTTFRRNVHVTFHTSATIYSNCEGPLLANWAYVPSLLAARGNRTTKGTTKGMITPAQRVFSMSHMRNGVDFPIALEPFTLEPGVEYTLRLSIVDQTGSALLVADISVVGNGVPFGGTFESRPNKGFAFDTLFKLAAALWTDEDGDLPLRYEFTFQPGASRWNDESACGHVGVLSNRPYAYSSLPPGAVANGEMNLRATILDSLGGRTLEHTTATVQPNKDMMQSALKRLNGSTSTGKSQHVSLGEALPVLLTALHQAEATIRSDASLELLQTIVSLISQSEKRNCSLAPDCRLLHRKSCWQVDHTCGVCEEGYLGVNGVSNTLCWDRSEEINVAGGNCTDSSQCPSGTCDIFSGLCTTDLQLCRGDGSSLCGPHGTPIVVMGTSSTPVDLPLCVLEGVYWDTSVYCNCDMGWSGQHCVYSIEDITTRDGFKAEVCTHIAKLDSLILEDENAFEILVDIILMLFVDSDVKLQFVQYVCDDAIKAITDHLQSTVLSGSLRFKISTLISALLDPFAQISSPNVIFSLIAQFELTVVASMVAGQHPVAVWTRYYQASMFVDLPESLTGRALGIPVGNNPSIVDKHYPFIELPTTASESCENLLDAYTRLVLSVTRISLGYVPTTSGSVHSDQFAAYVIPPTHKPEISGIDNFLTGRRGRGISLFSGIGFDILGDYRINMTFPFLPHLNHSTEGVMCGIISCTDWTLQHCSNCNVTKSEAYSVVISCYMGSGSLCLSMSQTPTATTRVSIESLGGASVPDRRSVSVQQGRAIYDHFVNYRQFRGKQEILSFHRSVDTSERSIDGTSGMSSLENEYIFISAAAMGNISHDSGPNSTPRSKHSDCVNVEALGVICGLLVLVISGFCVFRMWDQHDSLKHTLAASRLDAEEGSEFTVCAAFDIGGEVSHDRACSLENGRRKSLESEMFSILNPNVEKRNGVEIDSSGFPIPHLSSTEQTLSRMASKASLRYSDAKDHGTEHDDDDGDVGKIDKYFVASVPIHCDVEPSDARHWADFPDSSLLAERSSVIRFWTMFARYHSWWGVGSFASSYRPRAIRYAIACSACLVHIFVATVALDVLLQLDSECNSHTQGSISSDDCASYSNVFGECSHDISIGKCSVIRSRVPIVTIVVLCSVVLTFSVFANSMLSFFIESYCCRCSSVYSDHFPVINHIGTGLSKPLESISLAEKERYPYFYDQQSEMEEAMVLLRSATSFFSVVMNRCPVAKRYERDENIHVSFQSEVRAMMAMIRQLRVNPNGMFFLDTNAPRLVNKLSRARHMSKYICKTAVRPIDAYKKSQYGNIHLLRHFVLEQIPPIARNTMRKCFLSVDSATPDAYPLQRWVAACVVIAVCWTGMILYVSNWWVLRGKTYPLQTFWVVVVALTLIVSTILTELTEIWLLFRVSIVMQPQLRQIFAVLCSLHYLREDDASLRLSCHVKVAQHVLGSCRASHFSLLENLPAARVLRRIDDSDIEQCSPLRQPSWLDFGPLTTIILAITYPVVSHIPLVRSVQYAVARCFISMLWLFLILAGFIAPPLYLMGIVTALCLVSLIMHLLWKKSVRENSTFVKLYNPDFGDPTHKQNAPAVLSECSMELSFTYQDNGESFDNGNHGSVFDNSTHHNQKQVHYNGDDVSSDFEVEEAYEEDIEFEQVTYPRPTLSFVPEELLSDLTTTDSMFSPSSSLASNTHPFSSRGHQFSGFVSESTTPLNVCERDDNSLKSIRSRETEDLCMDQSTRYSSAMTGNYDFHDGIKGTIQSHVTHTGLHNASTGDNDIGGGNDINSTIASEFRGGSSTLQSFVCTACNHYFDEVFQCRNCGMHSDGCAQPSVSSESSIRDGPVIEACVDSESVSRGI